MGKDIHKYSEDFKKSVVNLYQTVSKWEDTDAAMCGIWLFFKRSLALD